MGTWQDSFLEMHCAMVQAAGPKARVIISKTLWKRIGIECYIIYALYKN